MNNMYILKKLKKKNLLKILFFYFSLLLIKTGIILRFPYLSLIGYILYLISNSNSNLLLYSINILLNKNKRYLILLEKQGFNEDSLIIKKTFKNINCIGFSRKFVKEIAGSYLSKDICDNNYLSCSPIHERSKIKLYKFYNFLFSKLPYRVKPIGIITGNFGYAPEQELFKAARNNNIKGIAIHKECLKTEGLCDYWKYIYSVRRGVFSGNMILNYNKIESQLQLKTKVINPKQTKLKIIGCPRLDEAHNLRKKSINKHQILMFGFGLKTSLPSISRKNYSGSQPHYEYLNREDKYLKWEKLLYDLCDSFYKLALENSKINFKIKLKEAYVDSQEIINYFNSKKSLKNIEIITKGNSIALLKQTSICICFKSTAIFEAIARGIPVIIPNFGECQEEKYKKYLFNFLDQDKDIITAQSKKDLESNINLLLNKVPCHKRYLTEYKKKLLEEWVGNPDGKSGKRLIDAISNELF